MKLWPSVSGMMKVGCHSAVWQIFPQNHPPAAQTEAWQCVSIAYAFYALGKFLCVKVFKTQKYSFNTWAT